MQKDRRIPPTALTKFRPVPRKCKRYDGWTAERQREFIAALADTGSVKHAAARVGMAPEGAYMLRRAAGAEEFCKAWDKALDHGIRQLEDIALERAIHGVEVPVYSYGKLVGTRTVHNDRLLMFMLRNRATLRFPVGASDATVMRSERQQHSEKAMDRAEYKARRDEFMRVVAEAERQQDERWRKLGIIMVKLEGSEAREFEQWRADRADRLGLPPPESQLDPPAEGEADGSEWRPPYCG